MRDADRGRALRGKGLCLAAAMIWGAAFFMMKEVTETVPVFWLLGVRFTLSALVLALICGRRWKKFSPAYLLPGGVFGVLIFAAYVAQTIGLQYTTPSNNAFLTATYCVMVPFLAWALGGARPDRWNLIAAVLCVVGIALVSLSGSLTLGLGDSLTLLCALIFALHIVAVNRLAGTLDVFLLTTLQLGVVGVLGLFCALALESPPAPSVFLEGRILWEMVYMVILATVCADLFQNLGQVWTDPSSASILLSLESVFGVIFSVLFYGDPMTPRLFLGFAVIFLAVLCSETKLSFLRKA